jgi:hypothetical protein
VRNSVPPRFLRLGHRGKSRYHRDFRHHRDFFTFSGVLPRIPVPPTFLRLGHRGKSRYNRDFRHHWDFFTFSGVLQREMSVLPTFLLRQISVPPRAQARATVAPWLLFHSSTKSSGSNGLTETLHWVQGLFPGRFSESHQKRKCPGQNYVKLSYWYFL